MTTVVETKNLTKRYRNVLALNNVSVQFKENTIFVLRKAIP